MKVPPVVVQVMFNPLRGIPSKDAVKVKESVWFEKMNGLAALRLTTSGPGTDVMVALEDSSPWDEILRVVAPTPLIASDVVT
jgi:hypothetical protein